MGRQKIPALSRIINMAQIHLLISFTLIHPLLAVPAALSSFIKRRKTIHASIMAAIGLAYLAYFHESRYIGDIERYMKLLELYQKVPFSSCFDKFYTGLYALDIFFWLCAKLPNARLLVAVTGFILYFNTFYVCLDYIKRNDKYKIIKIIIFIFTILPFYYYLSSIRSSLALSWGTIALYQEYVKKKKNPIYYLCYILPILFHLAGYVIILLRLALLIKGRKGCFIWIIGCVLIALMGSGRFNIAMYITGIFSDVSGKMHAYSAYGNMQNTAWFIGLSKSITARAIKFICSSVLCLVVWNALGDNKDNNSIAENMHQVSIRISLIILAMLFFPTAFYLRYFNGLFPFIILSAYPRNADKSLKYYILCSGAFLMLAIQAHIMIGQIPDLVVFAKNILLGILNLIDQ